MKRLVEILLFILLGVGVVFAQEKSQDVQDYLDRFMKERDSLCRTHIGKEYLPEFQFTTLDGDTINEKMLSGKVTFFNFWFESCAPCVAEFGALEDLYQKYKDNPDFQLITFSTDRSDHIRKTLRRHGLHFPVCPISRSDVAKLNYNQGFPTNIVIGKNRIVLYLFCGGPIEEDRVKIMMKKVENLIQDNL